MFGCSLKTIFACFVNDSARCEPSHVAERVAVAFIYAGMLDSWLVGYALKFQLKLRSYSCPEYTPD